MRLVAVGHRFANPGLRFVEVGLQEEGMNDASLEPESLVERVSALQRIVELLIADAYKVQGADECRAAGQQFAAESRPKKAESSPSQSSAFDAEIAHARGEAIAKEIERIFKIAAHRIAASDHR